MQDASVCVGMGKQQEVQDARGREGGSKHARGGEGGRDLRKPLIKRVYVKRFKEGDHKSLPQRKHICKASISKGGAQIQNASSRWADKGKEMRPSLTKS